MHPENIYKRKPVDFVQLAVEFPLFKPFVKQSASGRISINFRDPPAVRELSKCLLQKDFDLQVELPEDRLAPTIPSRLNYILWVQDLLKCFPKQNRYEVYDIGCGSSCIYPLLGVKTNSSWRFVASEVDQKSFDFAHRNVKNNNLLEKIELKKVNASDPLFLPVEGKAVDACMCNPPFFTDADEISLSRQRPVANSSCSGSESETIFRGGDNAFCERIMLESLVLKTSVKWFTTMLGKKSSFIALKKKLESKQVPVVTSTEFCQGRTMRWGLAWSFVVSLSKSTLPVSVFQQEKRRAKKPISVLSRYATVPETLSAIFALLNSLNVKYVCERQHNKTSVTFSSCASRWINCRKRKRASALQASAESTSVISNVSDAAFSNTVNAVDDVSETKNSSSTSNVTCSEEFACNIDVVVEGKNVSMNFSSASSAHREYVNRVAIYMKTKF